MTRRFRYDGPEIPDGGGLPEIGHVIPGETYELGEFDSLKIAVMSERADFTDLDAQRSGDLPDNFVARAKLAAGDITTYEALRAAERPHLLDLGLTEKQADRARQLAGLDVPAPDAPAQGQE